MLRQATNFVKIEGILSEVDLKPITYQKNGKDVEAIGGSITIRVNQTINGEEKVLDIPVHMFSSKLTNDGRPNPAYSNIEKVQNEFVSIASGGEGNADCVRITSAKITMNEFYSPTTGNLISQPRITASFVNKIRADECKPQATFEVEFAIASIAEEIGKDETPTGRLKIMGIVPQFGGKVDVVPFYTSNANVTNAIHQYWLANNTVKAAGKLNFSYKVETYLEEMDFGDPIEKTRTTSVSEFLITGGNETPLDETQAFDLNEINAALTQRKAYLDSKKEKDMAKSKTKATPTATTNSTAQKGIDLGF